MTLLLLATLAQAQAGAEGDGVKGEGFLGRGGGGGFDLDADLGSEVETVGTASPVSDFHALLRCARPTSHLHERHIPSLRCMSGFELICVSSSTSQCYVHHAGSSC